MFLTCPDSAVVAQVTNVTILGLETTAARIARATSTTATMLISSVFCFVLNFFHHSRILSKTFCTCSGIFIYPRSLNLHIHDFFVRIDHFISHCHRILDRSKCFGLCRCQIMCVL